VADHCKLWVVLQDEAKLLQQFAGTMNTFASDGSFLERMQQQQQQQGAGNIASPSSSREVSDAEDAEPTRPPAAPAAATAAAATAGKPAAGGGSSNQDRAAALRARLSGAAGQQQQQQGAADGAAAASAGGGNQSKAAMLRAKLMGKPVPPAATEPAAGGSQQAGRQVVALPLVDARGRAAPGAFGREGAGAAARALEQHVQGRAPKRVQRYGEGGDKERYYADDDAVDLQVRSSATWWAPLGGTACAWHVVPPNSQPTCERSAGLQLCPWPHPCCVEASSMSGVIDGRLLPVVSCAPVPGYLIIPAPDS
jgi:hypothetical protein